MKDKLIQKDKKGRALFSKERVRSFFDYELYEVIDNLLIVEFQIHLGYTGDNAYHSALKI